MYKILNGLTPHYLSQLIPPQVQASTAYPLRNRADFRIPHSRTQLNHNSYIPSTLRQWNALDPALRACRTFTTFKSKIKAKFKPCPLSKLYSNSCKYHTQIRLGLSKLRDHLFTFSIIPDPYCPNCPITAKETALHYFLECPAFAAQREVMLRGLGELLPPTTVNNNKKCVLVLVHGIPAASFDLNKKIFFLVQNYISETHRFSTQIQ